MKSLKIGKGIIALVILGGYVIASTIQWRISFSTFIGCIFGYLLCINYWSYVIMKKQYKKENQDLPGRDLVRIKGTEARRALRAWEKVRKRKPNVIHQIMVLTGAIEVGVFRYADAKPEDYYRMYSRGRILHPILWIGLFCSIVWHAVDALLEALEESPSEYAEHSVHWADQGGYKPEIKKQEP